MLRAPSVLRAQYRKCLSITPFQPRVGTYENADPVIRQQSCKRIALPLMHSLTVGYQDEMSAVHAVSISMISIRAILTRSTA